MRLLDRYLLRELFVPLGYCLGGFFIFWISFDLFAQMDEFQQARLNTGEILDYYLCRLPELIVLLLPIALLLALLYALTSLARHHELTAIRAAGVSLWRIAVPYLSVGVVFSILAFILNETLAPPGTERAEALRSRRPGDGRGKNSDWVRNVQFHNAADGRFWAIAAYNFRSKEMKNPHVDWTLPDGSRREINAESASYTNGQWVFKEVRELRYSKERDRLPESVETNLLAVAGLTETPSLIRTEIRVSSLSSVRAAKSAHLSLQEIRDYTRLHPALDANQASLLNTQFHGRLAAPWTCLVVVLIALPFGTASGRRNPFVGVASSIFIAFSYFVIQRFALALGTGGYVPGWLAAWFPNAGFAVFGFVMNQRAR